MTPLTPSQQPTYAAYQLIQIPPTDLHIPLILIQALSKLLRIHIAVPSAPAIVVASLVSSVAVRVCRGGVGLIGFRGRLAGGAAAEEPAEGVAY